MGSSFGNKNMKKFWLTLAHAGVIGAGVAGSIFLPGAAPLILPVVGTLNALIPSPLSKVDVTINNTKQ